MAAIFDTPLYTSDQSIDRVLKAGLPVELIFLRGTPPPDLDQVMHSLAKKYAGQLLVVQVQVDDNPQSARRFDIHTTPAVVTLKDGQVQSRAEDIYISALERHAEFLLGSGPRPEHATQPQTESPSQPAAAQPASSTGGRPVPVTDATFEQEVMQSSLPVVVDFWAPWCGPCRMVAPTLDKLAVEWNGRVKIAKVNVDENPMIAGRYGISGIPTMMVVRDGKIAGRWAGALPEPALRSRLGELIR